ncbi:hypothetical protein ACHAXT_001974 [Thalassiosira profunda]
MASTNTKVAGKPATFQRIQDVHTMRMPTKLHDGGSPRMTPAENSDKPDAFRRLSNDNVRMWRLLGVSADTQAADPQEADVAVEENDGWRQRVDYSGPSAGRDAARKTRLSTELHPDVLFSMLLEDADDGEN